MAQVDSSELTTGVVGGSGVFDVLMEAVKAHIDYQYDKNRLTGAQYAEVYLGGLTAAMSQSVAYVQGTYQKELIAAQVAMAQAQKLQVDATIELTNKQSTKVDKDIALADKQLLQADAQKALIDQQVLKLAQDTLLTTGQVSKLAADKLLTNAQVTKVGADKILVDKQILAADKQVNLVDKQIEKTTSEVTLLTQRTQTEQAQTQDWVGGLVAGSPGFEVQGTVAKQSALYTAQTAGFARKAEVDAAKIHADLWSISKTSDSGLPIPASAQDAPFNVVLTKMHQGIGV